MSQRKTVPPKREELVRKYEVENVVAAEAKLDADNFAEMAREALSCQPHDFHRAHHLLEQSLHALADTRYHRREELKLRNVELQKFKQLEDERGQEILQNAINYGERRLVRLESLKDLTIVQASLAHLENKIRMGQQKIPMLERFIIEENLEYLVRKEGNRTRVSFGNGWGAPVEGRRPQIHYSDAAVRLNDLKYQISGWKRTIFKSEMEKEENEAKWARLKLKMDERDAVWDRLDDAARRRHNGHSHNNHSKRRRERGAATQAAQVVQEIPVRREQEAFLQAHPNVNVYENIDEDEANQWEADYGTALEEEEPLPANNTRSELDDTTQLYAGLSLDEGTHAAAFRKSHDDKDERIASARRESSIQAQWVEGLLKSTSPHSQELSGWGGENREPATLMNDGWEVSWPANDHSFKIKQEQLDDLPNWKTHNTHFSEDRQTLVDASQIKQAFISIDQDDYDDESELTLC